MADDDNTIPNSAQATASSSPPAASSDSAVSPDCGGKIDKPDLFAGRYKIENLLGEGGMSRVYKGTDAGLNRVVAIKKMLPQYLHRDISRQRFQREAISIAALDHPNIVQVYHCDVTMTGVPFIVMECLNGKSLSSIIETEGPLSFSRALPVFIQIADALAHAHGRGVVHRDLKPSNVLLVTEFGAIDRVGIVDFGIARILPREGAESTDLTQTGEVFGSPSSMSPEQSKGRRVDNRSDIYSFACLMYETLTGEAPFAGDSVFEVIAAHLHETPKGINVISPNTVPAGFEKLALQMLAKNADDRPQTVDVVLQQLRAMQRDFVNAGSATSPEFGDAEIRQAKQQRRKSLEVEQSQVVEIPEWLALELNWEIPTLPETSHNEEIEKARKELESIVELKPTSPAQLQGKGYPAIEKIAPLGLNLGQIDVLQSKLDDISRAFSIDEVNSENINTCRLLADALMCVQLYHNAEPLYRKMQAILPDGPDRNMKIYKDAI
ncbi:MAG: serine/threonine protein kinase [Candidatus Melainabacteria bacterium]|nr:serine/threonine protein kinase [Candidatus Melainabacteria bacterium]